MTFGTAGAPTDAAREATPTISRGRPTLGVSAFLVAAVSAAVPYLGTLLFWAINGPAEAVMGPAMLVLLAHEAGMVTALAMGILAITTRRGRGWGIAAVVISVVLNQMLLGTLFFAAASLAPTP
jgi:hypothetical protein